MKYLNFSKKLAALAISAVMLNACDKVSTPTPLGDAGQTIVKAMTDDGLVRTKNLDLKTTPQVVDLVDIRRDVSKSADLDKTMTVIVKENPGLVTDYNTANGTNYIPLPTSTYTADATPHVGLNYTVTLKPGEFAQFIRITIPNALAINLNNSYAFGFSIVSADQGGKVASKQKDMVVIIGVKNKYDGYYKVTGTLVDVANAALGPFLPFWTAAVVTTGSVTNDVYDWTLTGGVFHPIMNAGANSYYGAFGLTLTFNPATDYVADMYNYWGTIANGGSGPPNYAASNTRYGKLDVTGTNRFDAGSHNITLKYFMYHPAVVAVGPRVSFNEQWTYLGPR